MNKCYFWDLELIDGTIFTLTSIYNPILDGPDPIGCYSLDQIHQLNELFKNAEKPDLKCSTESPFISVREFEKYIKSLLEANKCNHCNEEDTNFK